MTEASYIKKWIDVECPFPRRGTDIPDAIRARIADVERELKATFGGIADFETQKGNPVFKVLVLFDPKAPMHPVA